MEDVGRSRRRPRHWPFELVPRWTRLGRDRPLAEWAGARRCMYAPIAEHWEQRALSDACRNAHCKPRYLWRHSEEVAAKAYCQKLPKMLLPDFETCCRTPEIVGARKLSTCRMRLDLAYYSGAGGLRLRWGCRDSQSVAQNTRISFQTHEEVQLLGAWRVESVPTLSGRDRCVRRGRWPDCGKPPTRTAKTETFLSLKTFSSTTLASPRWEAMTIHSNFHGQINLPAWIFHWRSGVLSIGCGLVVTSAHFSSTSTPKPDLYQET